jgi:NTP pyrophosphatase (non-canonical NTP hydrolase)
MTFDDYQQAALTTALKSGDTLRDLAHWVLGVSGESGEIAEKVKKVIRDSDGIVSPELSKELAKEIGDVLWYLAVLADHLGVSFDEVAELNKAKLQSRKDRDVLRGSGDNR